MPFFIDYETENKFVNAPLSFTQLNSKYSPAFVGTKAEYDEAMQANKSLFDEAISLSKNFKDSAVNDVSNLNFIGQQNQWKELQKSLNATRSASRTPTTLIGFDFETLRMDVAHPYKINEFAAVTELGIAETVVYKSGISSKSNIHSIAGGINEKQLAQYLSDYATFKKSGLAGFKTSAERKMIESTMERLSRYGQTEIENLFGMQNIKGIGNVTVLKTLGTSQTFNENAIIRGLSHLAVLGGITEEVFEETIKSAGLNLHTGAYAAMQKRFLDAGLQVQTLDRNSSVAKSIASYFGNAVSPNNNTFVMGYNTNIFDINVYKGFIGDNLNISNTIDIYAGIRRALGTSISQEEVAKSLNLLFQGVAHTAGPDARISTEIALTKDFMGMGNLIDLITGMKPIQATELRDEKKAYYALNSIAFNKQGEDYLNSNRYNVSGVQRGRYYYLDDIREYKNGKYGIKFISANGNDEFIKVFDTIEEAVETVENNFLVDDITKLEEKHLTELNDYIVNADKARRNYEDLYNTRSITYNISDAKYEGGYEKIKQTYNAYNTVAKEIGDIDDSVIKAIAESSTYDEVISNALREAYDIPENKDVYKSLLRDFKAGFGLVHDEASMIGYMINQLEGTELDTYQKTIAINQMRNDFISVIENTNFEGKKAFIKNNSGSYTPSRRDMFSMDIDIFGETTAINFEKRNNAINALTNNFYRKGPKNATPLQVAESMVKAVDRLYEDKFVDFDFLTRFYSMSGISDNTVESKIRRVLNEQGQKFVKPRIKNISELHPRAMAEMLIDELHNTYVVPAIYNKNPHKRFTYRDFINQDYSKLKGKDALINFFETRADYGNLAFNKVRNRYSPSTLLNLGGQAIMDNEGIGSIFNKILNIHEGAISNIARKSISNATDFNISLDKDEITRVLTQDLNYSEASAGEVQRMLFAKRGKDPFGLTTYTEGKDSKKVKFITQFAYSGNKGEDAFVLVNRNGSGSIAKTMEIMSNDSLSFAEKINTIKTEGYSGVIQLKAINRQEINIDTGDPFYDMPYSYDTIGMGNKGYQKISQNAIGFWDHGSDDLKDLEMYLTDDANITSTNYRKLRQELMRVMDAEDISEAEKNIRISKMFDRANNNILADMPGPSGYQTLKVNNEYAKVLVPNLSDILQSQQLKIQPLELLALQTAKQDVLLKGNYTMARNFLRLAGIDSEKDTLKELDNLIAKAGKGKNISEEFNEYFLKHLVDIPMGLEENFKITSAEGSMSIIDYLYDRSQSYEYHKSTKGLIDWLAVNKDRFSQFVKEAAAGDKKISTIENMAYNQYAFFDSNIRPPANQQQTGKRYLVNEMTKSLGDETINKLELQVGYDVQSLQRAELMEALKGIEIAEGIKYGDLEDGITANFRQMNSSEIIGLFNDANNRFDEIFETVYKDSAKQFGIPEQESRRLLQQAFDIMKNRSSNVYESRGVARASFVNNSLFMDPELKTVDFNAISEMELEYLKQHSKAYASATKNKFLKQGTAFKLANGDVRIYHGPTGIIEDLDMLLTSGKGHLIEAIKDSRTGKINALAGMNSIKFYLGNEKGTLYTPEFNSNTGGTFIDSFGSFSKGQTAFVHYMDAVFDKIFGEDVSAVFDLPTVKHRTNSITYGSYMNRMFYNVNKYMQNTGDEGVFTELENMFWNADNDGIRIGRYKGQSTIDASQLGHHGAFTQVEKVIETLRLRAGDSNDKYQSVWSNIVKQIDRDDELGIFRSLLVRGINIESMGGAISLDPRMELNLRSQFQENIEDYITLSDGRKVNAFDYIADAIEKESLNGLADTSNTPIDSAFHLKRKSALKTVQGIELATQYMNNPELLPNSNNILDINLEDIILPPPGSNIEEISKTSIYKLMDSEGAHYSEFLRNVAKDKNKNIDDIIALKINIDNGIEFSGVGKNAPKHLNQLIIPLYDLTPFKGTVQFEPRIRDLNNALSILKSYGQSSGIADSRKELDKAISTLYTTMVSDLDFENKKSYVSSKVLRTPMKNSGMLHGESSIVPTINAVTSDYQAWTNLDQAEKEMIYKRISAGEVSNELDVASSNLTGRKYTTVINNKMYYDDIVEMSRIGFEQKGVDFRRTGADIFYNTNSYENLLIAERRTGFFDVDFKTQILSRHNIDTSEIQRALESYDDYENILYKLNHRKQYLQEIQDELANDVYGTRFSELTKGSKEAKGIIRRAKEHFNKIKTEAGILNAEFEAITERYLTEVGTYGLAARYPTFFKDSIGPVIFRLNNSLQRDEMIVSGVFGNKINMDHDADKGVVKLQVNNKGILLNDSDEDLYKAYNKAYGLRVYNLRNNEIFAELLEKTSTSNRISNLSEGNIHLKKEMIDKEMRIDTRNELLTELKLDHLVNKDVSGYTNEEVLTVFKGWDNKYGNMIRNIENKATSIKARLKNQIGSISNANYGVNQVIYESLNQAIQQGDEAAVNAYREIITDLHLGNMGLLPASEQKGIDVKHSYQGFTITEASKYNRGIKAMFNASNEEGYELGRKLITEAIGDKFVDDERWPKYLESITRLAKDERAKQNFKALNISGQINTINKALSFMQEVQEYKDYVTKNGLTTNTAVSSVLDAIEQIENSYTMGYYYNDIFQALQEDAVFVSTPGGKPVLYRVNSVTSNNGQHSIVFDTFDATERGKIEWSPKSSTIKGTAKEVQAMLQRDFGDFRSYSLAEILGDTKFRSKIKQETANVNVNKFANMYAMGNTKLANKFLSFLEANPKANGLSINKINDYLEIASGEDFGEFINKLKYLQQNQSLAKKDAFKDTTISDILANINRRIIEQGKNKTTSTSEIFNDEILKLAEDLSVFNRDQYKDFIGKSQKALTSVFDGYDTEIIDIRKATKDLSGLPGTEDAVNNIIEEYKRKNAEYIDSLNVKPATIYEMDTIFGWNADDLENMRVGINTESGLYGRRFGDLSEADIEEIIRYSNREKDPLLQHAYDTTKSNLIRYRENNKITNTNELKGADNAAMERIANLNADIKRRGASATQEGLNAKGKKISKETVSNLLHKTFDKAKEFAEANPGKATALMALAGLGLVGSILSGSGDSPLAPELDHKNTTGPINNEGIQKAPSSPKGMNRKTIYADSSTGLQFKMSAKSKNKINQMNTARQIAAMTNGDTNINVYDDRSQINNNWLERKFSELM